MDVESAVRERYTEGALQTQPALCCPVSYDPRYLEAIPAEIIEKDYGCGDPSRHLRPGDTVLDLGCGGGKVCYIASQVVGRKGRVIGVDLNDEMLALARRHLREVGERIGYHNVEFRKARIQDLRLDLEVDRPLVEDASIDVVVSNCVLNLVRPEDKQEMFREIFRVLRMGGRAAISDIVADEPVPDRLKQDAELWTGCVSGALTETEFLRAFEEAGFHGIAVESWEPAPFAVVEGIEFRSVTVTAHKGKQGPCWERNQAVIYKGPWSEVTDDDHHVFRRGERVAVCEKTFNLLKNGPYRDALVFIEPNDGVEAGPPVPFDCSRSVTRDPRETKGSDHSAPRSDGTAACEPGGGCC